MPGSVLGDALAVLGAVLQPLSHGDLCYKVQASSCAVSVPPTLEITGHPSAGNQVNITCQVNKFYPQPLQLTWLENGNMSRTEAASILVENKDGTFNQTSWLLVNSSAHREAVVLTCQVEHDGQLAVSKNHTLEVSAPQKDQDTGQTPGEVTTATDPAINLFFFILKVVIHSFYRTMSIDIK